MTRKNADYCAGYNAEAASLAQEVSRHLRRDDGCKRKIFARSPGVFAGMDAAEFAGASSIELSMRELKALGIDPGDNDPLAILDAHHAGRQFAKDYLIPGNTLVGGNRIQGNNGNKLIGGSASDSAESVIDRYIRGED